MVARPQQRRRMVSAGLSGAIAVLGLIALAPGASATGPAPTPPAATAASDPDVPHHPVHHAPPVTCTLAGSFQGQRYCVATAEQLSATAKGVGLRVELSEAIVSAVTADGVYLDQQRGPICDEGTCDFYLVGVWVPWTGSLVKPEVDSLVTVYGRTTKGSLSPIGWDLEGRCYDPYSRPC